MSYDPLLDALRRERFAPSTILRTPSAVPVDDEVSRTRRRRDLEQALAEHERDTKASA